MANLQIVDKSLKIATAIFPNTYDVAVKERWRNKVFHFTFVYRKNNLLAIGQNYPNKEDNKVIYFARKFNIKHWLEYPFTHSEIDAVSKLWGKYHIDNTLKFVVLRLNKYGELKNSRPCLHCQTVLRALSIERIWWSNKLGEFSYGM